ncbi:MAG: hypothetical protein PHS59_00720 [Paludibacter sp.]|nr:hypothetical protein [Paludibacter sp.]
MALAFMATGLFAQDNIARVTDNGNENMSLIDQTKDLQGSPNRATITQVGDKNIANEAPTYLSKILGLDLSSAIGITQEGANNVGVIEQTRTATNNVFLDGPVAGMFQDGKRNDAFISQYGTYKVTTQDAWVNQIGNDNESDQIQNTFWGSSFVLQLGDKNTALTNQITGNEFHADIRQVGDENTAEIFQVGDNGNTAKNWASADQRGDKNTSFQSQDGSLNKSFAYQQGEENLSRLYQTGIGNEVISSQYGCNNSSKLMQSDGSTADIYQRGDDNTLKGIMGFDDEYALSDNSSLLLRQWGDDNVLELYQENSSAYVRQNGSMNESLVLQH